MDGAVRVSPLATSLAAEAGGRSRIAPWLVLTGGMAGLYVTSFHSYLLFHSLVEIFSIIVAAGIFMLAWNSRRFVEDRYLLVLGVAYLSVGFIDLLHTLGYVGMGVFPDHTTNLATQLWIAARFVESVSLLLVPWLIGRRPATAPILIAYGIVTALLLAAIFPWHVFPTCFVEGAGLTTFKKVSEYVISLILVGALLGVLRKRREFDANVFRLLCASILVTIVSELAFTSYATAYSSLNLIGHLLKFVSYYLIYRAVIATGLIKPYSLLFRNLKLSERALQEANSRLEERVEARTAQLRSANRQLEQEIEEKERAHRALRSLSASNHALIRASDEAELLHEICRIAVDNGGYPLAWVGLRPEGEGDGAVQPVASVGAGGGPSADVAPNAEADADIVTVALQSRAPAIANRSSADPRFARWCERAAGSGVGSMVALPLIGNGEVLGSLTIYAHEPDAFDVDEMKVLKELAEDLAFGVGVLRNRAKRREAEEQLIVYRDQLRSLAAELVVTGERERRALARDLHDSVSQLLALSKMRVEVLRRQQPSGPTVAGLDEVRDYLAEAIAQTRSLMFNLSPRSLYDRGLAPALTDLAERMEKLHGLHIAITDDGAPAALSEDLRILLFRAVRELLLNVVKHAHASGATVSLQHRGDEIRVEVADDGVGFDPAASTTGNGRGTSFGLFSVRERLIHLGGTFDVDSEPGRGTRITLTVPLPRRAE